MPYTPKHEKENSHSIWISATTHGGCETFDTQKKPNHPRSRPYHTAAGARQNCHGQLGGPGPKKTPFWLRMKMRGRSREIRRAD